MANLLVSAIIFVVFSKDVFSDELKLGACPEVDVVQDFDYEKLLGLWYAVQKTSSACSCLTMEFKDDKQGNLTVIESSKPMGFNIPVMERFTQVGKLRVPSASHPAKMKVAFPFSIIPYTEVDFWIMDTDYTSYLAIWSCRPLLAGHRQSAVILSREPTLDQEICNKLREKFEFHNIDKNSLSLIDQKNCKTNPNPKKPDDNSPAEPQTVTITPTPTDSNVEPTEK